NLREGNGFRPAVSHPDCRILAPPGPAGLAAGPDADSRRVNGTRERSRLLDRLRNGARGRGHHASQATTPGTAPVPATPGRPGTASGAGRIRGHRVRLPRRDDPSSPGTGRAGL